ncbi:carboxylesterase/lipase family protein [Sphingomonas sp. 8AM]|uniref:carboxylesterase/lipase family protein n=1 Tax=Sphingomonas sp. 8AM TaxID=2653170 RepID=UPI0012F25CD2|nr:carboxylesterase family protein [Sphingomonas sp. 8AM]VXC99400.1 Carboxylic ester hydrolase [Sphingomonas sp. 8AM]
MRIGMMALVLGGALLPCAGQAQTVATESGKVAGSTAGGIVSWKGIPFAAPPVGALRWRAPQRAARWSGVRQAIAYGHDCMQLPFPSDAAPLGTTPAEDCLTVNVWKPAAATAKLPVVVWIYGGGFVNGGASPPTYSGANLARQGVMFVSFNYRLGRFGTFAHPQLTAQDPDHGRLGNYGYMDQLAALQWIHCNIAAFGGDPANVTIVGESAGGMSVNTMVTSPLTKGLFARAIVMSGGDGQNRGTDGLTGTEKIGIDFAASKGIARDDPAALAKLRALSADAVTDGLNLATMSTPASGVKTFASPYADGVVAVDAAAAYRSGAFPKIPIMIGATDNDIGGPTGYMVAGARQLAGAIAAAGAPAYHYRFSYVAESIGKPGAGHATDIPFFFDTAAIKYGGATTPRDRRIAETISAYVVNFAKTGDPNGAGLPRWPRYDKRADELLDFTGKGEAVPGKDPLGTAIDAAPVPTR